MEGLIFRFFWVMGELFVGEGRMKMLSVMNFFEMFLLNGCCVLIIGVG